MLFSFFAISINVPTIILTIFCKKAFAIIVIIINSLKNIKNLKIQLLDLKSRLNSFLELQINLPTDDLIRVIISKTFSDKQIKITRKHLEFIIKNIDRSYDKIFKFTKDIDNISLSTGKSININLIKKVLIDE